MPQLPPLSKGSSAQDVYDELLDDLTPPGTASERGTGGWSGVRERANSTNTATNTSNNDDGGGEHTDSRTDANSTGIHNSSMDTDGDNELDGSGRGSRGSRGMGSRNSSTPPPPASVARLGSGNLAHIQSSPGLFDRGVRGPSPSPIAISRSGGSVYDNASMVAVGGTPPPLRDGDRGILADRSYGSSVSLYSTGANRSGGSLATQTPPGMVKTPRPVNGGILPPIPNTSTTTATTSFPDVIGESDSESSDGKGGRKQSGKHMVVTAFSGGMRGGSHTEQDQASEHKFLDRGDSNHDIVTPVSLDTNARDFPQTTNYLDSSSGGGGGGGGGGRKEDKTHEHPSSSGGNDSHSRKSQQSRSKNKDKHKHTAKDKSKSVSKSRSRSSASKYSTRRGRLSLSTSSSSTGPSHASRDSGGEGGEVADHIAPLSSPTAHGKGTKKGKSGRGFFFRGSSNVSIEGSVVSLSGVPLVADEPLASGEDTNSVDSIMARRTGRKSSSQYSRRGSDNSGVSGGGASPGDGRRRWTAGPNSHTQQDTPTTTTTATATTTNGGLVTSESAVWASASGSSNRSDGTTSKKASGSSGEKSGRSRGGGGGGGSGGAEGEGGMWAMSSNKVRNSSGGGGGGEDRGDGAKKSGRWRRTSNSVSDCSRDGDPSGSHSSNSNSNSNSSSRRGGRKLDRVGEEGSWASKTNTNGDKGGDDRPLRPGALAAQVTERHYYSSSENSGDESGTGVAWDLGLVALYFLGSTILAVVFTALPLADPDKGARANWLYLFVWFPAGLTVVAVTFEALCNSMFADVPRAWQRRALPIVAYVLSALAAFVIGAFQAGFPHGWGFVPVLLCLAEYGLLYYSFPEVERTDALWARFKWWFLCASLCPVSFLIHIVFFLLFRVAGNVVQVVMLVGFCGLNIAIRNLLMFCAGKVHKDSRHIAAYFQEYLSAFTLLLAFSAITSTAVFVFTLFINLVSLFLYPIRMAKVPLEQQERVMGTFFLSRARLPQFGSSADLSTSADDFRLAAVRESLFQTFVMVCLAEVSASLAFCVLFPVMVWGPQQPYFPFLNPIIETNTEVTILMYGLITVVVEVVAIACMLVYTVRMYFSKTWRHLVRNVIAKNEKDAFFLFSLKLLVYLLAECILGLHFGAHVLMSAVFGVEIY